MVPEDEPSVRTVLCILYLQKYVRHHFSYSDSSFGRIFCSILKSFLILQECGFSHLQNRSEEVRMIEVWIKSPEC